MLPQKKSVLFGCIIIVAILLVSPLIYPTISQVSQQRAVPLTDVCQEGWSRYYCGLGVRLCISPDVESQYDLSKTNINWCNSSPQPSLPDVWAHVSPEVVGYVEAAYPRWAGYNFHVRVVKFDAAMIKDGDVKTAAENLQRDMHTEAERDAYTSGDRLGQPKNLSEKWTAPAPQPTLESYGLPPAPGSGKELCPTAWSRFSCQFVRLCVSPSVAANYDLKSSKEFGYAGCKSDNRSVSEQDTNFKPHDVGFAAGALLIGPRYFRVVKLDSSDIFDGNIEEAIQRLVLVPIPPSGLMEYDRGYAEGQTKFKDYLAKNRQRESEGSHKEP
jgi:hypothetical protein